MKKKVLRRIYLICLEGKEVYSEKNFFRDLTTDFSNDKKFKSLLLEKMNLVQIRFFSAKIKNSYSTDTISTILSKIIKELSKPETNYFSKEVVVETYLCFFIDRDIIEREEKAITILNSKKEELKQMKKNNKNLKEIWWLQYPPQMKFEFLVSCCYPNSELKKISLDKESFDLFLNSQNIDLERDIKTYNARILKKINFSAEKIIENLVTNLNYYQVKTIDCACQCPPKSVPLISLIKRVTFLDLFHYIDDDETG